MIFLIDMILMIIALIKVQIFLYISPINSFKEREFIVSPYVCDFPLRVWHFQNSGSTLTQVCVLMPAVRQVTLVTLQTGSLFD